MEREESVYNAFGWRGRKGNERGVEGRGEGCLINLVVYF